MIYLSQKRISCTNSAQTQIPLSSANTEGDFFVGFGYRMFYFLFRSNHLRMSINIISTIIPDTTPATTEKRKE